MRNKTLKSLIGIIVVLCLFCGSVTAFAENGDLDFDFNIQPVIPATTEEAEPEMSEEVTETKAEITEKEEKNTSTATTRPRVTRADSTPGNNFQNNSQINNKPANTETQTTEEELPEGAFYVYLERNNGEKRLKLVMEKAGLVPTPDMPVREGFVFEGWYSDSKLKNSWDFAKDKAKGEMTFYAKWVAESDKILFEIKIESAKGGKLEANPQKAVEGELVVINVTPDEGKRLVQGSITVNGKSTDFLSFTMPKGDVVISAAFEDIPETNKQENEKTKMPLIIIFAICIFIIGTVIAVLKKKKKLAYSLNSEEEALPVEDDGGNWTDESFVVKDGFKNGKKIAESDELSHGSSEADKDEEY